MLKVKVEGAYELIMIFINLVYEICCNLNIMYFYKGDIKLIKQSHNNSQS